ncbi:unnamed protein product [Miscanthus lutarioriparius]|uniref:Protein kinase domain-containing protein n=1 Tax=Miscanthus lutarioriparius TaxID=422564 RepID=A0A811R911_9POAL|nr:unnamed protein product [Miscanthus lutarioriparius]
MDDSKCSSDDMLECILQDPHSMPRVMTLEYLKRITDNFSDKRLLGEGGFGKVYKPYLSRNPYPCMLILECKQGELENGKMIAVKKFIIKRQLRNLDDQEMQFKNEVVALMSLRHPNIVRCVGYCFETSKKLVPCNGTFVLAESQQEMLLCLEYLTMGSLDERLQGTEEEIIMKIKEHVEKLREKSREVRDKIELAKGNGMVATNKIKTWLARADTILSDAMAVCESKQIGFNWDTRIAAAQLSQLRECLSDQPRDIAQPPSVLHIDVHAALLPSQVLFVEQARQHIIEYTEGMIGIWGPVGVGKTLLLKAINNSFETGNSLNPSSSNRRDPPFDFVIYMTALEDCSVQSIQSEIIQRLKMHDRGDSLTTQATRISKFLQDKSFLVLLDGLHYNLNLAEVGLPPLGNQGQSKRKVVITTRSRSLCDQMRVNRTINVPSLKIDEALELFQECIGNDSLYSKPRIGALAKDLVDQLRALPSELIRIGSAMRGKGEPGQWQNIIGVAKELMHIKDQEASSLTEGIVITKLKQCLQNLRGRGNDVNHEIKLGKRECKVATNQINNWLASVDTNISVGMVICESEQNEVNWDLSVIAAGMLRQLQECLSGQPSVVTVEALPPSVQEMPCSSTEQQPSRVEIFDEAMEYITDSSVGVIGIWGLGGVGKTHLLTKINNAFLGDSLFDHVIFITASKEGSVEKIQGEIGKKLKLEFPKGDDVKSRANIILDFLKTRNFLILLDNVWNRIDLEAVGIPYPLGNGLQQRRKVVLTTRSKNGETLFSSAGIEDLAKELVEELKGLPLALVTVGRSCCGGDDQDLHMENIVFRQLMFSYDSLRNDTLRECLLTCSLWSEDDEISTGDLIRCWIGLGLIDECDIHGSYRKAQSLIGELTASCLLDSCDTVFDSDGCILGRGRFTHQEMPIEVGVKMHNVIRDMAIWISCGCSDNKDKWVVRAGVGANLSTRTIPWSRAECISLMSSEIEELHPFTGSTNLKRLYLPQNRLDMRGCLEPFRVSLS